MAGAEPADGQAIEGHPIQCFVAANLGSNRTAVCDIQGRRSGRYLCELAVLLHII